MKKTIFLVTLLLISFTAATAQIPNEIQSAVDKMSYDALIEGSNGNYREAANCVSQAIRIVELQPDQENYTSVKAELWYDLTRYYSLQKNYPEALNALEKAIENGWSDYSFAENDQSLSNLRGNKKYKSIISTGRNGGQTLTAK